MFYWVSCIRSFSWLKMTIFMLCLSRITTGWKLFVVSLLWKKKDFFYNFICVLVSKANTAVMLRKPKKKSNSLYFGEILPFIQLTKVLKCTVFQKYKIKEWKRKIHLINWLTFSISILLFFMAFSHNMTVSSLSINKNYWKCLFVVKYNWSQPFVGLIPTNSY